MKNSFAAAFSLAASFAVGLWDGQNSAAEAGDHSYPWKSANSSIVLDAYEYTPIDWTKIPNNKRLAAFITKASDGVAPKSRCGGNALCRVKWRRYAATQELYNTRKVLAKTQGLKWGAYHLARPGNPIAQAEHFLSFTKPDKDDLLALDIEHNDPTKWMSLRDGEIFARHIKMRTGRYPVLYTNHSTSAFIAKHRAKYPLLSRLNLWYARYKPTIGGVFPMGNWNSYTIWQFSSMVNCSDKSCLWRINGAGNWIDVNVVAMSPEKLRQQWPFAKLRPGPDVPTGDTITMVKAGQAAPTLVAALKAPVLPAFRPGTQFAKVKTVETVQIAGLVPTTTLPDRTPTVVAVAETGAVDTTVTGTVSASTVPVQLATFKLPASVAASKSEEVAVVGPRFRPGSKYVAKSVVKPSNYIQLAYAEPKHPSTSDAMNAISSVLKTPVHKKPTPSVVSFVSSDHVRWELERLRHEPRFVLPPEALRPAPVVAQLPLAHMVPGAL